MNGFSKAFKRSLVISTAGLGVIVTAGLGVIFTAGLGVIFTAGLGVIVTSWRLGLIKPYMAFQGLLIYSMYYI